MGTYKTDRARYERTRLRQMSALALALLCSQNPAESAQPRETCEQGQQVSEYYLDGYERRVFVLSKKRAGVAEAIRAYVRHAMPEAKFTDDMADANVMLLIDVKVSRPLENPKAYSLIDDEFKLVPPLGGPIIIDQRAAYLYSRDSNDTIGLHVLAASSAPITTTPQCETEDCSEPYVQVLLAPLIRLALGARTFSGLSSKTLFSCSTRYMAVPKVKPE